ncbi:MAG: hypothetical protein AUK48_12750 [Oscillatoriales cyanobacterium CG2_30_44_21]|nr:MAG: hypothetical protein AUK48_12750 [Oscillatoriales cyanobacterium CG2_30_44_21]
MFEVASIVLNLSTTPNLETQNLPLRIAHEVKTSAQVGGTIHIEPHDRPVAGKRTRIWVALTKRGGEIIPYAKCNCTMEVRSLTNRNIKFQILNSFSIIEQVLGLPSKEVIFPEVGRYELKLVGSAKDGEYFSPFELTFTTNVGR